MLYDTTFYNAAAAEFAPQYPRKYMALVYEKLQTMLCHFYDHFSGAGKVCKKDILARRQRVVMAMTKLQFSGMKTLCFQTLQCVLKKGAKMMNDKHLWNFQLKKAELLQTKMNTFPLTFKASRKALKIYLLVKRPTTIFV